MKINNFNFTEYRAIVRVDFNMPSDEDGYVTDEAHIRGALSTLKKISVDSGALIMMSHIGKLKSEVKPELSLSQAVKNVGNTPGAEVKFAKDAGNTEAETAALKPGEVLLLENLRYCPEEEDKPVGVEKGTPKFDAVKAEMKERQKNLVKKLASYADIYINDVFGITHRKHTSIAVIADYSNADHKMLGYPMEKEVTVIDNVLKNAQHPLTATIGDSKVSFRLDVIKNLLNKADNLAIGGGMGYVFTKARGGKTGKSLRGNDLMPEALNVAAAAKEKGVNLPLSVATVCGKDFSNDTKRRVFPIDQIPDEWEGMDASDESIETWKKIILASKTIFWDGSVDVFELKSFAKGAGGIAKAAAQVTQESGTCSPTGGGDSVITVDRLGLAGKVSYASTGGGIILEVIEGKVLSGVAAIEK